MPRQLRLEYEGAIYHVMARGNRRQLIYRNERDRLAWLNYLGQACERTGWRVYGWVLMGNHYHLLVETPGANLVSGMQWLQTAYTVWFNRKHGLDGHLFGGRYKAVLIDEGERPANMLYGYVGTTLDYLHLNPIRAGIVGGRSNKGLLDYRWSSLMGTYLCSPRKRPKWAHVEMAFCLFGLKDSAAGRRRFLERLELRVQEESARRCGARTPEGQNLQSTLRRGWYFGSQAFRERLLALIPSADARVRGDQGQHYEAAVLMKDAAQEKAERILLRELRAAGQAEEALRERPRSDLLKWEIAAAMRKETTVSLGWIARRLELGSASNVCHKVGRSIFKS
jgi:putative transposase